MSLNNFEILNNLGKGSFGFVCLVKRKQDGKIYAMKRINLSDSPKHEIDAALNEVRLLASLNHINIIGYKEAFYDLPSNTLNIIMEFADGGDFSKRIEIQRKRHCLFNENIIWELIFQLLYGVTYLHSHQIMHRDLKPANIFLMKNGIVKIGDLNVSKLSKKNYARTKAGTPIYISPEIWDEKPYDYKCDIWSLGCIIYELCTLFPPFIGSDINELYNNVKTGRYRPISNDYSNDLKQIIEWTLVINPKKRISAKELLNSDIIQNRIKKNSRKDIIEKIVNSFEDCNIIQTLKIPLNKKNFNKILPHERYQMIENDPYENMKKTIKLMEKKEQNLNNKNKIINIQPLYANNRDMDNPKMKNIINLNNNNIQMNHYNNNIQKNYNNNIDNINNKPKIIKNEENENRGYYDLFKNNNKHNDNIKFYKQNNINKNVININHNNNHINPNNNKNNNFINNNININNNYENNIIINNCIKNINNNSNKKTSNKEINHLNNNNIENFNNKNPKIKEEEREKFKLIKNEFKNNEIMKNRMNHYEQLKQKIIQKRFPSGNHKDSSEKKNNNIQNQKNSNHINKINNNNNSKENNKFNINRKRAESARNKCLNKNINKNHNNINKNYFNQKNFDNRRYEIRNHNFNYNGKNFDMKPYKKENKVKYLKLNLEQYKENNKAKFNKYLKDKKNIKKI